MLFQGISRGYASWKRVRELLDCQPQLLDGDSKSKGDVRGQVEFRDVSFTYPGSGKKVLDHVSLTIRPGETLAIMGATGSGKTTLVSLIPRFYDVAEGSILIDGLDVRDYALKDLRGKVAIALQKSELFSQTIGENIAWGRPAADDVSIQRAAQIAQAEDFIVSAPDGYDTMVAQGGTSLSGGQKQRVSIARAILKNPPILILDESTSALDLKTEANLYAALKRENPGSTKIIVVQRIASVRHADRIAVLENGRISACGSHEELMACCKTYRDICDSQMGKEELA